MFLFCSYIIENGVCYLALCEPNYSAGVAFQYLETVHQEFSEQHGQEIHKAGRPYYFVEFGNILIYINNYNYNYYNIIIIL